MNSILRLPQVLKARGRSKTSHYSDIENGVFTHGVAIGGRAVGWPEHEVEAINAARIAGKNEDDIRELVRRLEISRVSAA